MFLDIKRELIGDLIKEKGWSKAEFARKLGLNYSYLHRLLKGERKPGGKFFSGFLRLCREQNLCFDDYVYIRSSSKSAPGDGQADDEPT